MVSLARTAKCRVLGMTSESGKEEKKINIYIQDSKDIYIASLS